jgi:hypothetical protein
MTCAVLTVPIKEISKFLGALVLTKCCSIILHGLPICIIYLCPYWTGAQPGVPGSILLAAFFNFLCRISSPKGETCVLYYTCSKKQVVIILMGKCRCRFPNAFATNHSACRSTGARYHHGKCVSAVTAASVPARLTCMRR